MKLINRGDELLVGLLKVPLSFAGTCNFQRQIQVQQSADCKEARVS